MNVVQSYFTGTEENTKACNMKIHSGIPFWQKVFLKKSCHFMCLIFTVFPCHIRLDVTVTEENS